MSRPLLLIGLVALLAACAGAASSGAPESGFGGSAEPSIGELDHATDSRDVILRYEEGGGFMMPAFAVTMAPHFTLYGDGTVIFRNPMLEPPPAVGPVARQAPFRTARLDEEQIQELLEFALTEGGLATARLQYDYPLLADASTATFTIRAAGLDKAVNVYALGIDDPSVPDRPARAQFLSLAERLTNFDQGGTFATDVYVPSAYRGVLLDTGGFPGEAPIEWPWSDISPSDFNDGEANGMAATRVMTPEELEVLGIDGIEGGFHGVTLIDPGDPAKSYTFAVRPLLPDETG